MRKILTLMSLVAVTSWSVPAFAQDKAPKHTRLSSILGGLQWGANVNDVLKNVEKHFEEKWQSKTKLLDSIGIDRLKAKTRAEFEKVKRSVVRFDGARTGFESSILAKEMLLGRNESLLKLGTGRQQRFYFFRDDSLWKIVVVRDATRTKTFPQFMKKLKAAFGKPSQLKFGKRKGKRAMVGARWKDSQTIVSAEDQRLFYNAFLVRFVQTGLGEQYTSERIGGEQAPANPSAIDPLVTGILGNDDDKDPNDDVVDRMTGQAHDLDLESGRPTYRAPNAAPVTAVDTRADAESDEEDSETDGDEKPKTPSKSKSKATQKPTPKKTAKPGANSGIVF